MAKLIKLRNVLTALALSCILSAPVQAQEDPFEGWFTCTAYALADLQAFILHFQGDGDMDMAFEDAVWSWIDATLEVQGQATNDSNRLYLMYEVMSSMVPMIDLIMKAESNSVAAQELQALHNGCANLGAMHPKTDGVFSAY